MIKKNETQKPDMDLMPQTFKVKIEQSKARVSPNKQSNFLMELANQQKSMLETGLKEMTFGHNSRQAQSLIKVQRDSMVNNDMSTINDVATMEKLSEMHMEAVAKHAEESIQSQSL